MPSKSTKMQVNHQIPRGEIKQQHGRNMKTSKTTIVNNYRSGINKDAKPRLNAQRKAKDQCMLNLTQMRIKAVGGQQAAIRALMY